MNDKPDLTPIAGALAHVVANPDDKRKPEDRDFDWASISPAEFELIGKIIVRARDDAAFHGFAFDLGFAFMDIATAHCMCGGLKLMQWLMADRTDFLHDFIGIARNIDRRHGVFLNDWRPLFAAERN